MSDEMSGARARNVLEWLEATAARVPDKVAVSGVDGELSFAALRDRARELGSWLAARLQPGTPVALYMEKSPACLAAMLGATYARCPYAVIDVRQPQERLAHIMATLEPGMVLACAASSARAHELLEPLGRSVVELEGLDAVQDAALLSARRASALDIDPLYVNFTSGSTGAPKGVAIAHRSVIDFIEPFVRLFGIGQDDRIGNQAPFDFDVSVKDIYSSLLTGATLHLIPRAYFSEPVKLMDFLAEREITTCTWAVSALCFVSIMGGLKYRVPKSVRRVIFSGEVMPPKHLARWRDALPEALFVNVYGPTEITCNCTYHVVERAYGRDEAIPIGRPFPNEKVFLLDEDGREVTAPGGQGEICVSGSCVGLGYYRAPELTAQAFVQNPLNAATRETIYRTGDLGSWNEAGELMYVGRKDHQIKHLGQRIELGEIESVAQGEPGVERACCAYNAKRKRIVLFFEGEASEEGLMERLSERLPHYMVPGKLLRMEALPLTKNGKVDRASLAQTKEASR